MTKITFENMTLNTVGIELITIFLKKKWTNLQASNMGYVQSVFIEVAKSQYDDYIIKHARNNNDDNDNEYEMKNSPISGMRSTVLGVNFKHSNIG